MTPRVLLGEIKLHAFITAVMLAVVIGAIPVLCHRAWRALMHDGDN